MSYAPPGWPVEVRPPGSAGWEHTAVAFLFDCCPADFRLYPVLRAHPVVLARFAAHFLAGQCEAARVGLAVVRTELAGRESATVVAAAADAWLEQSARLVRLRRAVGLVDEALAGVVFVPRLSGSGT